MLGKTPDLIIFDFDGVLTDNRVVVDENGIESVTCHRADGLAMDFLHAHNIPCIILSTETNKVVLVRAAKLRVPVRHSVKHKEAAVLQIAADKDLDLGNVMYVGNDVNDLHAMALCGIKVCPSDAHPKVKEIADYVLSNKGGDAFVRQLCEQLLGM